MRKKLFRKLRMDNNAGVTTYVLILFGMIFILYLFGFQSAYSHYIQIKPAGSDNAINSSNYASNSGIFQLIINALKDNWEILAAGGVLVTVATVIIGRLTNSTATILQYLIPAFLLFALNIFVFPFNDISTTDIQFAGTGTSVFLFAFFNICFILAVLEFIRGGGT